MAKTYGYNWAGATMLVLAIFVIVLCLWPSKALGFDLPDRDPWYFQSDNARSFWIPDKVQHYYGSQVLGEIGDRLPLPMKNVTVPVLAFAAGFGYEVYQDQLGIGFSSRDLLADALGVVASRLNSQTIVMWTTYSTADEEIVLNLAVRF